MSGFGGHKYAAGLTIEESKIPEFRECFKEAAANQVQPEDLVPHLRIDGEIAFRQHAGGHTVGPNWPVFIKYAERYLSR